MNEHIGNAAHTLKAIDELCREDRWINHLHPAVKLIVTVCYIALLVSFPKYSLTALLGMTVYPIAIFIIGEIPVKESLYKLRVVLPIVCVVGVFNPIFDRTEIVSLGNTVITGGVISMLTLMIKAVLSVLASYLLVATTSIEGICHALRSLHLPRIIVTEVLLIYRYIMVLLSEAQKVTTAYRLRAPGQKGVVRAAWGSLLGGLLLKSMDRAENVYESMRLRGFKGEYPFAKKSPVSGRDIVFLILWLTILILLRIFPVFYLVGGLVL